MKSTIIGILLAFCTNCQLKANPFKTDSLTYTKGKITYGATLSYPQKTGKVPAIILISGTGPQNRDGEMAKFKFFKEIADYFNSKGVAVLRVDDRGVGKTTGNYFQATTEDFAQDVEASLEFLKKQQGIDPKKIGLLGHSEGGAVSFIVASRRSDVAFVISMAGLATKGIDALRKQNADLVATAKIPEYDKKRYNEINELMFQTVYDNVQKDSLSLAKAMQTTYDTWKKKDNEYVASLGIQPDHDHFRFPIYSYTMQATGAWYRYHIMFDPALFLPKVKVPVLALNGDKDLFVSYKENLENIERLLKQGGNRDVTTKVITGVNHLFLACQLCTTEEYNKLHKQFPTSVLSTMGDWILNHTK